MILQKVVFDLLNKVADLSFLSAYKSKITVSSPSFTMWFVDDSTLSDDVKCVFCRNWLRKPSNNQT